MSINSIGNYYKVCTFGFCSLNCFKTVVESLIFLDCKKVNLQITFVEPQFVVGINCFYKCSTSTVLQVDLFLKVRLLSYQISKIPYNNSQLLNWWAWEGQRSKLCIVLRNIFERKDKLTDLPVYKTWKITLSSKKSLELS